MSLEDHALGYGTCILGLVMMNKLKNVTLRAMRRRGYLSGYEEHDRRVISNTQAVDSSLSILERPLLIVLEGGRVVPKNGNRCEEPEDPESTSEEHWMQRAMCEKIRRGTKTPYTRYCGRLRVTMEQVVRSKHFHLSACKPGYVELRSTKGVLLIRGDQFGDTEEHIKESMKCVRSFVKDGNVHLTWNAARGFHCSNGDMYITNKNRWILLHEMAVVLTHGGIGLSEYDVMKDNVKVKTGKFKRNQMHPELKNVFKQRQSNESLQALEQRLDGMTEEEVIKEAESRGLM
jgi:hypothetical protein